MRSTLDDIDEDEPTPIVVPAPSANQPSNPSVMDDLFGPSPTTGGSHQKQPQQAPSSSAPEGQKKTDALDDFFSAPSGKSSPGSSISKGSPAFGGAQQQQQQPQSQQKADVFDSLFSASPASQSSPAAGTGNAAAGIFGTSATPASSNASPTESQQQQQQLKSRSAKDQLDAFSAVMSGGAAPWMKTTSVADSRAMDFDGNGKNTERVFVPPDSVLSLMTLYDVLGAAQTWTLDEISKAYKKKALALHPDKLQGGRTEAEERYFKVITASYDVLKDTEKRAEYDSALRAGNNAGSSSWLSFVA